MTDSTICAERLEEAGVGTGSFVVGFHAAERVDGDARLGEVLAAVGAVRPGGHRGRRQVSGRRGAVVARLANRI